MRALKPRCLGLSITWGVLALTMSLSQMTPAQAVGASPESLTGTKVSARQNVVADRAPDPAPPYSLAGGDEFNDSSPLVDRGWIPRLVGLGDDPIENTIFVPENVSVADGNLRITTRRHCLTAGEQANDKNVSPNGAVCPEGTRTAYASARIDTGFIFSGTFSMEVRARMADDAFDGLHFAAWMQNDQQYCPTDGPPTSDIGELDTMEVYTHEKRVNSTTHLTCGYDGNSDTIRTHSRISGIDLQGQWHVFKMTWDGYAIRYYVDGKLMAADSGGGDVIGSSVGITQEHLRTVMNAHPWRVVIDSYVFPKDIDWVPPTDDTRPFPERVDLVDYVRVRPLIDVFPSGPIGDLWRANPDLGDPVSAETDGPSDTREQNFTNGTIRWSPGSQAQIIDDRRAHKTR